MAARKREATNGDALAQLYEQGLLFTADSPELDVHRVSTGIPVLDEALGGGYAYGRNVMIVGPESTGKTILAQYAAASIQRDDPDGKVLLVDAEMSYEKGWWEASGVDLKRLIVTRPGTGEQAVETVVAVLRADPSIRCVIIDSIAALSPMAIQEKASGERTIAGIAVVVANLFAKIMPINKQAVFIALNQLRANLSGYDDNFPGGWVLRHNSHIILRTRREGWIKDGSERVGYVMDVHVKKNKLGQPEETVQIPFLFASQIDLVGSYIDEAVNRGIITAHGPYFEWDGVKVLGKGALRQRFAGDETEFERLKAKVEGRVA